MAIKLYQKLLDEYNNYENRLNGNKLLKINQIRRKAIETFSSLGFPTLKNEEWKYTPVHFLNQIDFGLQLKENDEDFIIENFDNFFFNGSFRNRLVFINGFFNKRLSTINIKDGNIKIGNFAEAALQKSEIILNHFAKYAIFEKDTFTAINTAFTQDGAYIVIPENTIIEEPINLIFLSNSNNGAILTNPRNLIVAGANSQVKFIESCFTIGSNPTFTNLVTEISAEENSIIEYSKYQNHGENDYYIGTTAVIQEGESRFDSVNISLSGRFIRNNMNTILNGKNCEANLNGLYFIKNNDFTDNHTLIDHAKPHSASNEYYKGIMLDESRAVFNGKIIVRQDSQKTQAYQKNKNLLLSEKATINTKPQLEIFADDVKCSHGTTTGYLDNEAMYYLRSRGISEQNARSMLINAFAGEIIEKISVSELRNYVKKKIAERLDVEDIYFCKM
jgi:Fe-S cluster assembly protein SufD